MTPIESDTTAQIDDVLQEWEQGDCVVAQQWFVFRCSLGTSLTNAAVVAATEGLENAESEVFGFVVVTQTCDIVRACHDRPFVEVCPLVEVDADKLSEIERCRRPNYAYIRGTSGQFLVADLDRVMTVEKPVVAQWNRTKGCIDDTDRRKLSLALARKRARVAFPDDFVLFAKPLAERMSSKHSKRSAEGDALRRLREIRVRAAPSWESAEVELTFWFIRTDEPTAPEPSWAELLDTWLKLTPSNGRFTSVEGLVISLDDLTARDYIESDPLDLDHLSGAPS